MQSPSTDPLTALVEDSILAGFVQEKRMERILGPVEAWSCDLRTGLLQLGDHEFRVDALGTESHANGTFVWGWANPTFSDEQMRTSLRVRDLGRRLGVEELLDERAIPLERMNGDVAGVIATAALPLEAHYVAVHDEGALVLAVNGPPLTDAPFALIDLAFALTRMVSFAFPFDHRRAVESFAESLRGVFAAEVGEVVVFSAPGGRIEVSFDAHGRATGVNADLEGGEHPLAMPDGGILAGSADETQTIGTLDVPGDELVVCDPFTLVDEAQVRPLGGSFPAGTHEVDVWLIDDPAGGRRVQVAYLFFVGEDEDDEVVDWQPAETVPCDSGILCFTTPSEARRLVRDGEAALAEVEAALEEQEDTWARAALDDLVAFSVGFCALEYEIALGFNAVRQLVCVTIDCVDPGDLERDPSQPMSVSGSPGRGLQRVYLLPAWAGGPFDPRNIIVLPPASARELAARFRAILRGRFDRELALDFLPEYDDDGFVPARLRLVGSSGRDRVDEVIEVRRG